MKAIATAIMAASVLLALAFTLPTGTPAQGDTAPGVRCRANLDLRFKGQICKEGYVNCSNGVKCCRLTLSALTYSKCSDWFFNTGNSCSPGEKKFYNCRLEFCNATGDGCDYGPWRLCSVYFEWDYTGKLYPEDCD